MYRSLLLATLAVAQLTPCFAQQGPAAVLAGGPGRTYVGGPGTYNQIEQDVAAIADKVIASANITQREDRDFLKAAVNELHQAYVEYANSLISGEILEMEAAGIRGQTVDVAQFMRTVANLKAKDAAFRSVLVKLSSINKEVLPSNYNVIATGDGQTQAVPSVGLINMKPVVEKYESLIKTSLEPQLAAYTNIKVDIYGQVLGLQEYKSLLTPDFSNVPSLSPDKRAELNNQMEDFRARARLTGASQRLDFATVLRNEYNDFGRRYGSDYRYVYRSGSNDGKKDKSGGGFWSWIFGTDESQTETGKGDTVKVDGVNVETDFAARNASFKRLIDVFWMRSYLRLSQGIQICAVQPKRVNATNFGAFQAIEALKELRSEPACTKNELEEALEYARRILKYSGAQSDHVFDAQSGFMKAGLLNKLGSAYTFVRGKRPAAEALNMLIQLVYADIQEELILATPGRGLRELRYSYHNRYQSDMDKASYYKIVKCSIDYDSDSCGPQNSFDETPGVGMGNDVRGIFLDLKGKIQLGKDFIDQANRIQATLDAARNGSASHGKAKNRASDL